MNAVGRALSSLMITRWCFEALGRSADLNNLFQNGTSPIANATRLQFGDSFSRDVQQNWLILVVFMIVFFVLTCVVLWRKSARAYRARRRGTTGCGAQPEKHGTRSIR